VQPLLKQAWHWERCVVLALPAEKEVCMCINQSIFSRPQNQCLAAEVILLGAICDVSKKQ
jgi:hypothetical protein